MPDLLTADLSPFRTTHLTSAPTGGHTHINHIPHTEHYIKTLPPIKKNKKTPPPPPPHSVNCKTSGLLCMCTLVNAWLVDEKTPPVQVAEGQDRLGH